MDFKNISEELQIVRMIVSRWGNKYNISPLEHTLVMDKIKAVLAELDPVEPDPILFADEKEEPVSSGTVPVTEDEDLPTMSEIEREIIMHEMGGLPDRMVDDEAAAYGKRRSERQSLKSLYYDEKMTADEKAVEVATEQTISEMAAEINRSVSEQEREAVSAVAESKKVLGDVINSDAMTISDTYKPKDNGIISNITSKETLRKAIGLNDRYLLIRDLFRGDSALYEETVAKLDSFDDLDDAMLYIHDNFHWDPNGEGSKLIVELLVHKLS